MSLKQQITEDMKTAMRAKETARLGAIRLLLAAMKQREVDERIELTDADVVSIIEKMLKQRRDSISQYKTANRQDLVDVEEFEVSILQAYMPQQLSEAEIVSAIAEAIAATGASGPQDMGKVMGVVKAKLAGRADMGKVSGLIKAQLTKS
ncbi:MAG: GatB/YqeY domain-containing protein [Gallionella sp.]|nr:GatB/YqeY domain-containing protein [Gallionella sp.]